MLARYIAKSIPAEVHQARLAKVLSRLHALDVDVECYLFGSAARGTSDVFSDIDIYVIFNSMEDLKKSSRFLNSASIEFGFPMDWILTTQEEHLTRSQIGGLAYDIAREGVLFYEGKK